MKRVLRFLKNILIAPFLIYIYNLVASPLELIVPINFVTVVIIGILGLPGLITLIVFKLTAF